MSEGLEHYRGIVRRCIDGRPLVLTGGALHAALVVAARELGAPRVFALDKAAEAVGADASAMFAAADWRDALDAFDPGRQALVLGLNYHDQPELAGRHFVGPRQKLWAGFEDKTAVGQLWAGAGLDEAPSVVVEPSDDALVQAAAGLDAGQGTVWAGDHRDGEHNSGRHLRWVNNPKQAAAAAKYFRARCDRVRLMPFLDGQACGIHGFVAGDDVAVLAPIALDVHHDRRAGRFSYQGCRVDWAIDDEDRDRVRSIARRVGQQLQAQVGYRGSFSLDGVLTAEGFRPTELNARWGASLTIMAEAIPELPLRFIHAFMSDGHRDDWQLATLESLVLDRLGQPVAPHR